MEVLFLTGVGDKAALAARLLRKKHHEGARVAVYGAPAVLARIDQLLWESPALDFVPHLRWRAGQPVPDDAGLTRIWLLDAPQPALGCDSAVNLGYDDVEQLTTSHARVAEVIGETAEDRAAGQQRWRAYKAAGHVLQHLPQSSD